MWESLQIELNLCRLTPGIIYITTTKRERRVYLVLRFSICGFIYFSIFFWLEKNTYSDIRHSIKAIIKHNLKDILKDSEITNYEDYPSWYTVLFHDELCNSDKIKSDGNGEWNKFQNGSLSTRYMFKDIIFLRSPQIYFSLLFFLKE